MLVTPFLIGHGLVHGIMWALPLGEEAGGDLPIDPAHSRLLDGTRYVGFAAALVTTVAFLVAAGSHASMRSGGRGP